MPYIIDGHNLIPKLPGLELSDIDDESRLIELLQEFCRRQRKRVEVYFDNAPPVERRAQSFGAVTARFVRQGTTADAAIRARLARLGRSARNWTVVSSDQEVQAAARQARAHYLSAEAFAARLLQALEGGQPESGREMPAGLSEAEIEEWLEVFGKGAGTGSRKLPGQKKG
jgi:uncharacterized protein